MYLLWTCTNPRRINGAGVYSREAFIQGNTVYRFPILVQVPRLRLRTDTHTQTHTQDNYRNPPAHVRRRLIIKRNALRVSKHVTESIHAG